MPTPRRRTAALLAACVGGLAVAVFACSRPATPVAVQSQSGPSPDAAPSIFEDITAASGISFTHRNGQEAGHFAILETLGGGVGLIDYDRDGLLDVFVTGGGYYDGPD